MTALYCGLTVLLNVLDYLAIMYNKLRKLKTA